MTFRHFRKIEELSRSTNAQFRPVFRGESWLGQVRPIPTGNAIGQGASFRDHSRAYAVDQLSQQDLDGRHPFPNRHWNRRLLTLIKFINNCAPSVIGVQETRDDMAVDITNGLGPNWTFWGSGTAKIIWDSTKWIVATNSRLGCHTP